jgi:hypothetical protein
MGSLIDWPVFSNSHGWMMAHIIIALPVLLRADWAFLKSSPAIGADICQNAVDAGSAERAFMAANPCVGRLWRQRLGAILTDRTKLKHGCYSSLQIITAVQFDLGQFCHHRLGQFSAGQLLKHASATQPDPWP